LTPARDAKGIAAFAGIDMSRIVGTSDCHHKVKGEGREAFPLSSLNSRVPLFQLSQKVPFLPP
jgi:hypothetical protein